VTYLLILVSPSSYLVRKGYLAERTPDQRIALRAGKRSWSSEVVNWAINNRSDLSKKKPG